MATLMDRLVERGRIFIRFWKRDKKVGLDKREVGACLMTDLLDAGLTKVDCGRSGTVVLASGTKKEITKAALVAFFGEGQGAKFWESIEAKTYEYLTVVSAFLVILVPSSML